MLCYNDYIVVRLIFLLFKLNLQIGFLICSSWVTQSVPHFGESVVGADKWLAPVFLDVLGDHTSQDVVAEQEMH